MDTESDHMTDDMVTRAVVWAASHGTYKFAEVRDWEVRAVGDAVFKEHKPGTPLALRKVEWVVAQQRSGGLQGPQNAMRRNAVAAAVFEVLCPRLVIEAPAPDLLEPDAPNGRMWWQEM